jgi:ankyrin repeat protein
LSRAAEKGHERIVKLLLENGARPDFEDEPGQTPLSRAQQPPEPGQALSSAQLAGKAAIVELLYYIP